MNTTTNPVVLVVDDDPGITLLVTAALEDAGFDCLVAESGEEAVDLWNPGVDVVLLDIMMPGIDGYMVCETIRSLRGGRATSIVMMTGLDDVASVNRAYDCGATDFITKPINYPVLEHRLRYIMRAADATRVRSQFLANMSHELRTPLNGILGVLDLVEGLDETQEKLVGLARQSGEQLLHIIDEILNFEKLDADKVELEPAPVNLFTLVADTRERFGVLCAQQGIGLTAELDEQFDRLSLLDKNRLQQVLGNLLANAIKFTEQGTVTIRLREAASAEYDVAIDVSDTGIGIPADRLAQLFSPFEQVDSSTTRKYGGTGLGLVISRKLVELMGGTLSVTSTPARGSTFTLSLPLSYTRTEAADGAAVDAEARAAADESFSALHVLIAEDNRVNQLVIQGMLRKYGIEPEVVTTGRKALQAFSSRTPSWYDLILMDISMPDMDGLEATEEIRSLERAGDPAKPVKIFALSAHVLNEHVAESRTAGMDGHLAKPIDRTQLFEVLCEAREARRLDSNH